jgi:hypothetical protein
MADQLIINPISIYLTSTTAGQRIPKFTSPAVTLTQTTVGYFGGILSIGSGGEEDITFNFVKFGPKSGGVMVEFGRLYPDGSAASLDIGPSGVTLRMIADTAACKVLFWLAEK